MTCPSQLAGRILIVAGSVGHKRGQRGGWRDWTWGQAARLNSDSPRGQVVDPPCASGSSAVKSRY